MMDRTGMPHAGRGVGSDVRPTGRRIVLAAAGSGKTHRLTSRLIALIALGVPPEEILVSTFTRKAAGEIVDRVLVRLASGVRDAEAARSLAQSVEGEAPGLVLDREQCAELLSRTLRSLHRLQVHTLDAFFYRVARSFAPELELPQNWTLASEPEWERLRARSVEAAIQRIDPEALGELVTQIGRGPADRPVQQILLEGARELHETFVALDPRVLDPWGFEAATAFRGFDPLELDGLILRLEEAELPSTQEGKPDGSWAAARGEAIRLLRNQDWTAFVSKGIAKAILERKESFSRKPIPPDVRDVYLGLLGMARSALGLAYQRRVAALGRFLPRFDREMRRLGREEGLYHFQDLTHALMRTAESARSAELFYRLDGRIRHLLLDEFQDTSNAQWAALQPIVSEILSGYREERAVFIVADPKQSIFGWRGGEPRLLDHLKHAYGLEAETMSRSRRSSSVVLEVVNRVFGEVAEAPALSELRDEVAGWAEAFEEHRPVEDRPGFARLETGPEEDSDLSRRELKPRLLAYAAERTRELSAAAPGATIGILTRTNASAAYLITHLRRLGVEASEEGGVPVTDSAPVLGLLALLRMVDHPADTASRYLVASTPVRDLVGIEPADWRDEPRTAALVRELRERLLREGYGPVVSDWARALAPIVSARDRRRLRQLTELAFRWDERASLRSSDFVALAASSRAEDPASARVRVMTIHRAKGLEFDAVVLPDLDALSLTDGTRLGFLAFRVEGAGPVQRVFPRVGGAERPLFPELDAAESQAREGALRDALSTLYVGLTRARHAVHMIVAPDPERRFRARTAARLLRESLATGVAPVSSVLWEQGDPQWWQAVVRERRERQRAVGPSAPLGAAGHVAAPPTSGPMTLRRGPRRRLLHTVAPSYRGVRPHRPIADLLRRPSKELRERGAVVHAWLERIRWIEDGLPPDAALIELARATAPRLQAAGDLLEAFSRWIQAPEIRRLLSRDAFPSETTVYRERPFLVRNGAHIVEGRADRVVSWTDEGGDRRILIVDWKTEDSFDPEDVEAADERAAVHEPQLQAYRSAFASIEGVDLERVEGCVAFVRSGVARTIVSAPKPSGASP